MEAACTSRYGFLYLGKCQLQQNNAFSTRRSLGSSFPPLTINKRPMGKAALHAEFTLGAGRILMRSSCNQAEGSNLGYACRYYMDTDVPALMAKLLAQALREPLTDVYNTPRLGIVDVMSMTGLDPVPFMAPISHLAAELWYTKPAPPPWIGRPALSPLLSGCIGDDEHILCSFIHLYCYMKTVFHTMLLELPANSHVLGLYHMIANYIDVALLTQEIYTPEKQRMLYAVLLYVQECHYFAEVPRERPVSHPYRKAYPWLDFQSALNGGPLGISYITEGQVSPAPQLCPNLCSAPHRSVFLSVTGRRYDQFYTFQDTGMYHCATSPEWRKVLDNCAVCDYVVYRKHVDGREWTPGELRVIPAALQELELFFTLVSVPLVPRVLQTFIKESFLWNVRPLLPDDVLRLPLYPNGPLQPSCVIPFRTDREFENRCVNEMAALLRDTHLHHYCRKSLNRPAYVACVITHCLDAVTRIRYQNTVDFAMVDAALSHTSYVSEKQEMLTRILTMAFTPGLGTGMYNLACMKNFAPQDFFGDHAHFLEIFPEEPADIASIHADLLQLYPDFVQEPDESLLQGEEEYVPFVTPEMKHLWQCRVHITHWRNDLVLHCALKEYVLPLLMGSLIEDYFAVCSYQNAYMYLYKVHQVYRNYAQEERMRPILEYCVRLMVLVHSRVVFKRHVYTLPRARIMYEALLRFNTLILKRGGSLFQTVSAFPWQRSSNSPEHIALGPFVGSRTTLLTLEQRQLWARNRKSNVGVNVMVNLCAERLVANCSIYRAAEQHDYATFCRLTRRDPGDITAISSHRAAVEDLMNPLSPKAGCYSPSYRLSAAGKQEFMGRMRDELMDPSIHAWLYTRDLLSVYRGDDILVPKYAEKYETVRTMVDLQRVLRTSSDCGDGITAVHSAVNFNTDRHEDFGNYITVPMGPVYH
ncbi:ORF62 [Ranid herpesvirus 2]|uniref:ORF62 n=1 Tax=Ranid herpesvirus 2 TaxID=389214 RepID=Q14W44_9VIRU|nr:ORF62 [Ranid herpesvirus 2]ABG25585.1 ORF62 [Ranid herpesvirus 2]